MDDAEVFQRLSDGVVGKTMRFINLESGQPEEMKIVGFKPKGSNSIFVGESRSVGFFLPLSMFSLVKEETDEGWVGGDLIEDVTIDSAPYHEVFSKLLAE